MVLHRIFSAFLLLPIVFFYTIYCLSRCLYMFFNSLHSSSFWTNIAIPEQYQEMANSSMIYNVIYRFFIVIIFCAQGFWADLKELGSIRL